MMNELRGASVLISMLLGSAALQDKPPPPSAVEQADAEKMVKEVFKADYAKRSAADRQALAKQLLTQALQSKDDAKIQFVLLREAKDVALQSGDPATAMTAIDEMSKRFAVDAPALRILALSQAARSARSYEDYKGLVGISFKLMDACLSAEDYEDAERLAGAALQYAKKSQDVSLVSRVTAKSREIADTKAGHEKLKKAREILAVDPDDGASNHLVGRFLCLVKGDWEKGLPLLAKGSDPVYGPLAQKDLAAPADSNGQVALGDAWWDLSEKEASPWKERLKDRSGIWYAKALNALTGLTRTKIEKRLAECKVTGLLKGTWVDMTDPKLFNVPGKPGDPVELSSKPGQTLTQKMQFPKGEFDGFSVRITVDPAKNISAFVLYDGPDSLAMVLDAERGFFGNLRGNGSGWALDYTDWWTKDSETVLTVLLEGGHYILHVNGVEKTRVKTTKARIEFLGLEARNAPAKFDRIKLRRAD